MEVWSMRNWLRWDLEACEVPQSAFCSWRLKKVNGVIQSKSEAWEPRILLARVQSNGRKDEMSQFRIWGRKGGADSCFLCLTFCSIHNLNWWDDVHIAMGHLLKCHILTYANLSTKHPHRHTQKCLVWASMAGQNWHIKIPSHSCCNLVHLYGYHI